VKIFLISNILPALLFGYFSNLSPGKSKAVIQTNCHSEFSMCFILRELQINCDSLNVTIGTQ